MILISHDLSVMAETCDKVAIMYGGKMMELGKTVDVFTDAKHPYTQGLVAAFPDIRGQRTMPVSISTVTSENCTPLVPAPERPSCHFPSTEIGSVPSSLQASFHATLFEASVAPRMRPPSGTRSSG